MRKTIKMDGEFSELNPNSAGIPCRNENSEKLRKEHDTGGGRYMKIVVKSLPGYAIGRKYVLAALFDIHKQKRDGLKSRI